VISWQVVAEVAWIALILVGYWAAGQVVARAIQRVRASDTNGGDSS